MYQDEVRNKTAQLLHHLGSDWMLKSDYKRIRHLSLRLAAIFAREGTLRFLPTQVLPAFTGFLGRVPLTRMRRTKQESCCAGWRSEHGPGDHTGRRERRLGKAPRGLGPRIGARACDSFCAGRMCVITIVTPAGLSSRSPPNRPGFVAAVRGVRVCVMFRFHRRGRDDGQRYHPAEVCGFVRARPICPRSERSAAALLPATREAESIAAPTTAHVL